MDTGEFFAKLYDNSEGKSYIWTLPDKSTTQFSDWDDMANKAIEAGNEGKNVYYSIGLTEKPLGQYERAKNTDIVGIPALWVDIDFAGEGHAAQNLPPDYASARGLLPAQIDPSIIVFSGHGIHAYYMFREMLDTRTDEERTYATNLLKRLQGAVRANAQTHGWHIDSVTDLCRVFRVPGTMNRKNGMEIMCQVAECDESSLGFNPDDFDDILPDLETVTATSTATTTPRQERFERRPTDGNATLMMANCNFLQYWQMNYRELSEPVWKAACTNIMRGVDGENIILPIVREWQGNRFKEEETLKKLRHYLNECTPQTCEYIKRELGFQGCANCQNIKSPCAWSLAKIPQAIARIRAIVTPTAESVFTEETLLALATLKKDAVGEYAKFEEKCRGRINLNDLRREIKKRSNLPATVNNKSAVVLTEGQQIGDVTTQQTVPSAPLNLRIPPNFSFGYDGVHEVKKTDYGMKYTLCSGQPIIITRKVYNIDTATEKIGLAFLYYGMWHPILAKRSEVFSARGIVNMTDSGLNASSESAKPLVRYLQALEAVNPEIPIVHAVSKIGWREKSISEFVLPSANCKYMIDMEDDGNIIAAFNQAGNLTDWLNFAKTIRGHTYARFLLAASFATPLLKIFNERNFMVYFWGTSGGAKTAAMYFAISVWGAPDKMVRSFYGTTNGIERAAEYSNDFPLAINERQVMMGSNRQDSLEALVYMLEGGRGKVRASRSGLRTMATWRTISIGTGEEPLSKESSVQGIKTRIIEINTYPVLPNDLGKSVYDFTGKNHGTAGVKYIERLLEENKNSYHDVLEARRNLVARLASDFPDCLDPHIDAIAMICTADFLVSQWLFGETSEQAAQGAYNLAVRIALQMPTKQEVSDTERAWNFTVEWLVSNKRRFDREDLTNAGDTHLSPEYGFIREGCYNVYPSYLMDALEQKGFRAGKILKEFADRNYINAVEENGKRRFKLRLRRGGERVYVVQIPLGDGMA